MATIEWNDQDNFQCSPGSERCGADNIFISPGIMTGNMGGCASPESCLSSKINRCKVLLEPHTSRYSVQPPLWRKGLQNAERRSYRQRAYVWKLLPEFGFQVADSKLESECLTDIPADNFVEMIRFFSTLILNADESMNI